MPEHKRTDAKFCSDRCRKRASRAVKNGPTIPKVMKARERFVRYTATKRPLTVAGRSASSIDPATWSTFQAAVDSAKGVGVGFVLGDGIGCIDLDDCIDLDGIVADWAQAFIDSNPNTFIEVSSSGRGLHVFGWLDEAPGTKIRDGRKIEVYSRGRYIALTGKRFGSAPLHLADLVMPEAVAEEDQDAVEAQRDAMSLSQAIIEGSRLDELLAMRRIIARAFDNPLTAPRELVPLSRRLDEINKQIETLKLKNEQEAEDRAALEQAEREQTNNSPKEALSSDASDGEEAWDAEAI